jgi:hypothetical protein
MREKSGQHQLLLSVARSPTDLREPQDRMSEGPSASDHFEASPQRSDLAEINS